jgi:hypothetical protein
MSIESLHVGVGAHRELFKVEQDHGSIQLTNKLQVLKKSLTNGSNDCYPPMATSASSGKAR